MKIYLAGKINKNCWRHSIVAGLGNASSPLPAFVEGVSEFGHGTQLDLPEWPVLKNAIFGHHDYVGPYFRSCDHGCFHGDGRHGVAAGYVDTGHGCFSSNSRDLRFWGSGCDSSALRENNHGVPQTQDESNRATRSFCLEAIDKADLIFCWVDREGAYGTACELGYARARGKNIRVASPNWQCSCRDCGARECFSCRADAAAREMWFPLSCGEHIGKFETPLEALRCFLGIKNQDPGPASFVYFIEAVGLCRVKIGKAIDPENRIAQLQTGSPVPLRLIGKTAGGHPLERKLHEEFHGARIDGGEWFHLTKELRSYIEGLR